MLLIRCPYCEMERPELEFRHGGEAHVARPLDPVNAVSDDEWASFLFFRRQSERPDRRALAPFLRLRPLLQLRARHGERQDPDDLSHGRAKPDLAALAAELSR